MPDPSWRPFGLLLGSDDRRAKCELLETKTACRVEAPKCASSAKWLHLRERESRQSRRKSLNPTLTAGADQP